MGTLPISYQRVVELCEASRRDPPPYMEFRRWLSERPRRPADTFFTAGPERNIALEVEMKIAELEREVASLEEVARWA